MLQMNIACMPFNNYFISRLFYIAQCKTVGVTVFVMHCCFIGP